MLRIATHIGQVSPDAGKCRGQLGNGPPARSGGDDPVDRVGQHVLRAPLRWDARRDLQALYDCISATQRDVVRGRLAQTREIDVTEEVANKLPVKMTLPLGLFIFPVILLVVLLPVGIRLTTLVLK